MKMSWCVSATICALFSVFVILSVFSQSISAGVPSSSLIPSVLVPWYAAGIGSLHRFDCRLGYQNIQGEIFLARWFKDEQEFYRFKKNENPKSEVFDVPGVNVDVDESGASVVALYDVDESTSGRYKCLLTSTDETELNDPALTSEFELKVQHPNDSLLRSFTVRHRVLITATGSNSTASINCFVDERPGKVYSYKWYKDDAEFYRYVPWNAEQTESVFEVAGVQVDLGRSNGTDIVLVDVGTNSTGLYKCVASTSAALHRALVHRVILEFSEPETATTNRTDIDLSD